MCRRAEKRGLTFVGTLRKNKREIPPDFLPTKTRDVGSTLYGFTKDITLVSHVPKKNKAVLLLSSMHHNEEVNEEDNKPEIISYYNSTKGGVDEIDKKCSNYNSSRRTLVNDNIFSDVRPKRHKCRYFV